MKIGIGIDTGGTYTDAVAYDFEAGAILGSAKALTTRHDLTIGILGALDGLPAGLAARAELVSLSTTLATNACVEDRGGNARLVFFGGEPKIIDECGGRYGLPPSRDIYIQESYTTFSGETEREPDWDRFRAAIREGAFAGCDSVAVVEMNATRGGASAEKTAKAILTEMLDLPVVCGHELFSELNSLQRASSALLNARLFPIIREFLDAIKLAMAARGIAAPVVVVRSDGSLMSEEFAAGHPVETLLCGPAASAIGGARLTGEADAVIVDMGGTTTDIALVRGRRPVADVDGVAIGKWRTFVDGLYVKTVGLGGDTAVHYSGKLLRLEDYRVVPLCVAADRYPAVKDTLRALQKQEMRHTRFLHEHYILVRDLPDESAAAPAVARDMNGAAWYTDEERAFCAALRAGPLSVRDAPEAIGLDMYRFDPRRLIREGVVQVCGLTPTDVMHIRGDFTKFDAEAARLAADYVARNVGVTVEALCDWVCGAVKRRLYHTVVEAMLENAHPRLRKTGISPDVAAFIDESYDGAESGGGETPLLSMGFRTDFALVGIGAPVQLFLGDVARRLGARAVIAEHHEVANALGSISGDVHAARTVEIKPNNSAQFVSGFSVHAPDGTRVFESLEAAEACALAEARRAAEAAARQRGAGGAVTVTASLIRHEAPARDGAVFLGVSAVADAVGVMGFSHAPRLQNASAQIEEQ